MTDNLDIKLDILGQQPLLKIYTQMCLCFPIEDDESSLKIINTLDDGLQRLFASFPWLAGQVADNGDGDFRIKQLRNCPQMTVKDLRNSDSSISMQGLREKNFPISLLDEKTFCPRTTLPDSKAIRPVLLIQATFIDGGLVLCILGEHKAMDGVGQGQVMHLFSKACHGMEFTREEIADGNVYRPDLVPLMDDAEYKAYDLTSQQLAVQKAESNSDTATQEPVTCIWANFLFSAAALSSIKKEAEKNIDPSIDYISTDDAHCAFIWQAVIRARQHRLKPSTRVTFARAIDVRRYLNVSATYPGLMQNMTYSNYTVEDLIKQPIGKVASTLRYEIDPKTSKLEHNTRGLASHFIRAEDKNSVSFTAALNLSSDIMLSSWVKLDTYNLDFNLGLGKPEAVRRPRFDPVESLMYLLPKAPNGEVVLAICLSEDDMQRLQLDSQFTSHAKFIG